MDEVGESELRREGGREGGREQNSLLISFDFSISLTSRVAIPRRMSAFRVW